MVTLKDIAERAGVSMMTVSRVMNSKEGKVSEKTASRIRSLADEMGYIPNSSARSLAAKSSQIIAVILRDSNTFHPLSDPYNASFLGFITREIQKRGFYVMIHFVQDFSDITFSSSFLECRGCHFPWSIYEEIQKIQNRNKIPLVFIDSYSNVRQLINIGIDDYKGGQLAAEYFLKNGHKTLGFVGPFTKTGGVISKRYQGFSDTLLAHQITLFDKHVYDLEHMDPQDIIDSISHDSCPPTGLFVFSDETALQLINIASNKGWDIPSRLSFIGFDDLPSFCTFLTSLRPFIRIFSVRQKPVVIFFSNTLQHLTSQVRTSRLMSDLSNEIPYAGFHSQQTPGLFRKLSPFASIDTISGPNSLHARSVFSFIPPLPMITRTPVSFTNSYSNFSILILVVGPTDTIRIVIFQWTDDRSCMEDCVVSYIYRKRTSSYFSICNKSGVSVLCKITKRWRSLYTLCMLLCF